MSKILTGWLLASSASTVGPEVDHLYNIVLLLTGMVFVLTEAALIYFCLRYRERPGQKASHSHGNTTAEIIWTTIPALIMVTLGFMSQNLWARLRQPKNFPENAIVVRVMAEQWLWHFKYDGPSGEMEVQNDFHIHANTPFRFELTGQHATHAVYLPAFRINHDALP